MKSITSSCFWNFKVMVFCKIDWIFVRLEIVNSLGELGLHLTTHTIATTESIGVYIEIVMIVMVAYIWIYLNIIISLITTFQLNIPLNRELLINIYFLLYPSEFESNVRKNVHIWLTPIDIWLSIFTYLRLL